MQSSNSASCVPPIRWVSVETRRQVRNNLRALGLSDEQLLEPFVAELRQWGCRARVAWRLANDLSQSAVATQYNEMFGNGGAPMAASRISEFESWPLTGDEENDEQRPRKPKGSKPKPRPTIQVLQRLADIYHTSWDQLVDLTDLVSMPEAEREQYRTALIARTPLLTSDELPAEVTHFVGRDAVMHELQDAVNRLPGSGGAGNVYVIDGSAGIGKTAVARHAVDLFGRYFPDGRLWIDLGGHTPGEPLRSVDVLEQMLLKVGVSREIIAAESKESRAGLWRRVMRDRRRLLVFDNVLDSDQIADLLPQAPDCLVLITSRNRLTKLSGANRLHLEGIDANAAETLLVELARLGPDYDREAIRQILEVIGRLPLAIRHIAGQIAHRGPELLPALAAELQQLAVQARDKPAGESAAARLLDSIAAENESLEVVLDMSYQRLPDPELQRAVRLLGWFPGREITAELLAAIGDLPLGRASTLMRRLFESGFLDAVAGARNETRYRIHDVTWTYARARAERDDPSDSHRVGINRLIRHCLYSARAMGAVPQRSDGAVPHASATHIGSSNELGRVRSWLQAESDLLVACIEAARPSPDAAELAWVAAAHLGGSGRWQDAEMLYGKAVEFARDLTDRHCETRALVGLGRVSRLRRLGVQAAGHLDAALQIAVDIDDRECQAGVLVEYGHLHRTVGNQDRARKCLVDALQHAQATEYSLAACDALNGLGFVERVAGNYGAASRHFAAALEIAGELDDGARIAAVLWGQGETSRRMGDLDLAWAKLTEVLAAARLIGDRKREGDALRGLGHIERNRDNPAAARIHYDQALAVALRIGDQHGEIAARWGQGEAVRKLGHPIEAREIFELVHAIIATTNEEAVRVDLLRGFGHLELAADPPSAGNLSAAGQYYATSLALAREIDDSHGTADALRGLGVVAARIGDRPMACRYWSEALGLYARLCEPQWRLLRAEMDNLVCD